MLWKGFQRPKRVEAETETLTATYGRFTAQPFERGFATTIGNALRRCLLSSIEGAARALFVHANTVRYRLRLVTELSDLSPTRPRDALTLQLALVLGRQSGRTA